MSISNSLVCNFFTVSLSIGLAAFILSSQSFDKRTVRLFLSFVATVLLLTASDIADYAIEQSGIYSVWRYVSSALG